MIPFYNHQTEIFHLLQTHRFFAIFAEQGTGKTLPMLAHILALLKAGAIRTALIICPKAVRGSWERDVEKFFNKLDRVLLRRCITITTYDLIWRRPELDRQWDLMVLDESHHIKNRTSNRYVGQMGTVDKKRVRLSRGIKQISENCHYRYIMTGTPIGNSHWEEIWSQFNFLSPGILGKYSEFEARYCILNQFYKPFKYINVDELKEIYFTHSYRITKIECLDLPDKLPPERFTLELLEKRPYKEMLKNYIAEFDIEAFNPLARLTKLRQICSGSVLDDKGIAHRIKCEKISVLNEFLSVWEKKLVIFAEYKQSIADIISILKKKKISYISLDGEQKDKNIWQRFQAEQALEVIVCQYRTANAGIDLYASDTIIFYEPTLSSQIFEQACDRIHRPGQQSKCSYILFETEGTIEFNIWNALMKHRDFNETELQNFVRETR